MFSKPLLLSLLILLTAATLMYFRIANHLRAVSKCESNNAILNSIAASSKDYKVTINGEGQLICGDGKACNTFSQNGEDIALVSKYILKNPRYTDWEKTSTRVVVEIGGNNGLHGSNSLFFETYFGWKSVLIEGSSSAFAAMRVNRPKALNINMAACSGNYLRKVNFTEDPGLTLVSGVQGDMADAFVNFWHTRNSHTYEVDCGPVGKILNLLDIHEIDFFSIDVEGSELVVLESIDFSKTIVHYFLIEMDGNNKDKEEKIRNMLLAQGYYNHGRLAGFNELFLKSKP